MRTFQITVALLLVVASHLTVPLGLSEAAQPQTDAVVIYNDGSQVVIRDWRFRYEFGASNDSPYEGRAVFYTPQSKESVELCIEMEHGLAPALLIKSGDLQGIRFDWTVDYRPPSSGSTVSSTTVGLKTVVTKCDGSAATPKWPKPAREFLTDRRFLLEPKILLVGDTVQGRFSVKIDAYETDRGNLGAKVIREIRFRCSRR